MRIAVRSFIILIVLVNVPGAEGWLRGILSSEAGFKAVAWVVAVSAFGLAVTIWLGAIQHLRGNVAISAGQRTYWRAITYGAFIFGALIYYWRFMRRAVIV
jgi:hypothetical protein